MPRPQRAPRQPPARRPKRAAARLPSGRAEPRATRSEQKAATRDRIVKAAWELFNRDGYDATTTKAVAERARVAVGTVFVHARDKPELLFLVMSDMITASVDEAFRSLPAEAPFVEQVLHLFRGPVDYYARHPRVARAFLRALPGADGPNAAKLNGETLGFLLRLAGVIAAAAERGELARDFAPPLAAQAVFSLYYMCLLAWLNGLVPIESVLDPMLRDALGLLVRGIGAAGAVRDA
jgi:TetR/AcrR family transcriptional regulator, cholesterol catabolism regulator